MSGYPRLGLLALNPIPTGGYRGLVRRSGVVRPPFSGREINPRAISSRTARFSRSDWLAMGFSVYWAVYSITPDHLAFMRFSSVQGGLNTPPGIFRNRPPV